MDRTRQTVTRKENTGNQHVNQPDLTDSYRTLHSTIAEDTFFSSAHGTFSRVEHMLGHRKSQ